MWVQVVCVGVCDGGVSLEVLRLIIVNRHNHILFSVWSHIPTCLIKVHYAGLTDVWSKTNKWHHVCVQSAV